MKKVLVLLIVGLAAYIFLVGVFYALSASFLQISIFKSTPEAAILPWIVILGVPAVLTAGIMSLVFSILFGQRNRSRR